MSLKSVALIIFSFLSFSGMLASGAMFNCKDSKLKTHRFSGFSYECAQPTKRDAESGLLFERCNSNQPDKQRLKCCWKARRAAVGRCDTVKNVKYFHPNWVMFGSL